MQTTTISVTGEKNSRVRRKKAPMSKADRHIHSIVARSLKERNANIPGSYNDTAAYTQSATTTPTVVLLTAMPQSTGQEGRIRDVVFLDEVTVTFDFNYSFTSILLLQDIVERVRFGLFVWKENTLVASPVTTQLWQVAPATAFTISPWNYECRDMYEVLLDERTILTGFYDSATTTCIPVSNSVQSFTKTIKLGGRRLMYNPTATTGSGHLYLFFFSDSGTAPHPIVSYYIRLAYHSAI